ncbi:Aminopeptidase P1 [Camellia lanceoleosa]|uniref:Aminopeptidase P1 n=1 Tax=Camellia lanceoleosa TaxID=1840588 RepID=A0ACC0IN71_9ERIC|nr:Aminopeptidase P1 [Camellia lanceoleosa]
MVATPPPLLISVISLLPPLKSKISKQQKPNSASTPALPSNSHSEGLISLAAIQASCFSFRDNHQSRYVSNRDKTREFVSGFTGSAGLALTTRNEVLLWTDGRYFLQAALELSDQGKLMHGRRPSCGCLDGRSITLVSPLSPSPPTSLALGFRFHLTD